jgi:hypothetical protein
VTASYSPGIIFTIGYWSTTGLLLVAGLYLLLRWDGIQALKCSIIGAEESARPCLLEQALRTESEPAVAKTLRLNRKCRANCPLESLFDPLTVAVELQSSRLVGFVRRERLGRGNQQETLNNGFQHAMEARALGFAQSLFAAGAEAACVEEDFRDDFKTAFLAGHYSIAEILYKGFLQISTAGRTDGTVKEGTT